MKRIRYYIDNCDEPCAFWAVHPDGRVTCHSNYGGFIESVNKPEFFHNNDKMRTIPKREAKSLFPEAFK